MKHIYSARTIIFNIAIAIVVALSALPAAALNTDIYAKNSKLATGKWVKVSVEESGMHFIPATTLRSWGFTNPETVRVFGYGANRPAETLNATNFIDDLPVTPSHTTQAGIYFYAVGPVNWTALSNGRFYHTNHPYSLRGYYFLTDAAGETPEFTTSGTPEAPAETVTTFMDRVSHELDKVTLGKSGAELYGESFIGNTNHTYKFQLPGLISGTAWARTRIVTDGRAQATVRLSANGSMLPSTYTISAQGSDYDSHIWGMAGQFDVNFAIDESATDFTWGINFNRPDVVNMAHLDFIDLNYPRALNFAGPQMPFTLSTTRATMGNVPADIHIWDITKPMAPAIVDASIEGGSAGWRQTSSARKSYIAWQESPSLPSPAYVGALSNQDLHGRIVTERPDMVIFTVADWASEAERMANLHRYGADSLSVMVVDHSLVYNEFSSGVTDPMAMRRFLKMAYDLGRAEGGNPLRYVLLMGSPYYDNRRLTDESQSFTQPVLPAWQSESGLSDYSSYTSDDYFGLLADNTSPTANTSQQAIAVGRIPCRNTQQAKAYVDKLISYIENPRPGTWRNTIVSVADNADEGAHLNQTESMLANIAKSSQLGSSMTINKAYLDAFDVINGICVGARNKLHHQLNEGALLWTYVGHGSSTSITGEHVFESSDIDNLYNRNLPVFYGATCDYSKWDNTSPSGAERLFFLKNSGVIASISATRTAQISANGNLSNKLGEYILTTDAAGRVLPLGESLRLAKNELARTGDSNRRRFVLMGSPAMRPVAPELIVKLETINGEEVSADNQITLKARQRATLTGIVCDASGNKIDNFNGTLYTTIFDAPESITTKGLPHDGTEGKPSTYDDQSSLLAQCRDSIIDGQWSITVALPLEISDNFRPALASFFANSPANKLSACGTNSDFYIFGVDETAEADTIPPTIDYAYINHETFTPGSVVNEEPMFIASVSDNVGINLSMAGIGHQMTLTIDGKTTLSDVNLYYQPHSDGRQGGVINYPLPVMTDGNHSVTLRVWDTSGNVTYHTVEFFVQTGARPDIFDIYSDANPASAEANFYLQHNRPDAVITVTFEVYDMLGRLMWTSTQTDRSDMFTTAPMTWDLRTRAGTRVTRGIYIYRAIVTTDQGDIKSKSKRIAVSGH